MILFFLILRRFKYKPYRRACQLFSISYFRSMSSVLLASKSFDEEGAGSLKKLVETHWGVHVLEVKRLMGYEIATYCVETEKERFILKQYPNSHAHKTKVFFENKVLDLLRSQNAIPCPALIPTSENIILVEANEFVYRLQTYLTGAFLAETKLTQSLLRSIGGILGRMDKELLNVTGPYPIFDQDWDLKHSSKSERLLEFISSPSDRRLAAYFLYQFKAEVLPRQYGLPEQLIYADANEWNLLTDSDGVSGIIDFGDMCYSWRINELAIGLAYALMFSEAPLDDAVLMIRGYHEENPLTQIELEVLYYLIAVRLASSVCRSAKNKMDHPDNEYFGISEKRAWKLLYHWIRVKPEMARKRFEEAIGFPTAKKSDTAILRTKRDQFLNRSLSLSYKSPIHMVRSALQYMYDADGNTYLDAYNNIMLVGHSHPKVLEAGIRTYTRINTNTRYLYNELTVYAENLLSLFPSSLCRILFVNSGSAAADLALRMAHHHTGSNSIIALEEGYHGNTVSTIKASPYKTKKGKKANTTIELELPNAYLLRDTAINDPGNYYAQHAIKQIREHKQNIAAFIAEPIVGCGGQVPLPAGYLQKLYPEVRAAGGVCISDEVQVGFGRLGKAFWGFELHEVVPDIVILGKPMGNGHPIGAVVTTEEIASSFESGPEFFSSFGGNPVSCAIGSAVLEVIREEALQEHALQVGTQFKDQLFALQKQHPEIGDVRGEGLFLGVEIANAQGEPDGKRAIDIVNIMKDLGVLVSTDGPFNQVIKIKPPLCFSLSNVEEFLRKFRKSLIITGGN